MLERFITKALNAIQPKEITAGEAMATFVHKSECPAFGKNILEQADFLQIGQDEKFISIGGGWVNLGGLFTITYIRCSSCGVTKVFQERG